MKNQNFKKWFNENVLSLLLALLLVLVIRSSIIEAFKIPSGSMIPTLLIGDHIFVNKFAYGFKLPFTDWLMDKPIVLIERDPPKRGDIVVFKYPKDESIYYIKRTIGTPGDTIQIKDKILLINNKKVDISDVTKEEQEKIFDSLKDSEYDIASLELHKEKLDSATPTIMIDKGNYFADNFGPILVPDDHLFVMGDNRDSSNDSRFWGFVPMNNVKGKAIVIWLSLWINFSDFQVTFRPLRTGTVLN